MISRNARCLIVADSVVIRPLLQRILTRDPEIEVVGTASDPWRPADGLAGLQNLTIA